MIAKNPITKWDVSAGQIERLCRRLDSQRHRSIAVQRMLNDPFTLLSLDSVKRVDEADVLGASIGVRDRE